MLIASMRVWGSKNGPVSSLVGPISRFNRLHLQSEIVGDVLCAPCFFHRQINACISTFQILDSSLIGKNNLKKKNWSHYRKTTALKVLYHKSTDFASYLSLNYRLNVEYYKTRFSNKVKRIHILEVRFLAPIFYWSF